MSRIHVTPIREAVLTYVGAGHSWTDICKELGWMDRKGAETSRLQRCIGARSTNGKALNGQTMSYENAVHIIRAIGRDPVDFNL